MSFDYPIRLDDDPAGAWEVYRGDESSFPILDRDDAGTPTNLTTLGSAWTSQLRSSPDGASHVDITVDASAASTGQLVLTISGDDTAALTGTTYHFDVQVTGGPVDPLTVYAGTIIVTKDITR